MNLSDLFKNAYLVSVVSAWLLAQIIKIFTGYFNGGKFSFVKFFSGTGGMPSSHSATVMALFTTCVLRDGLASYNMAASLLLAIIVMSDATGVRYETGKQAKIINELVKEIFSGKANDFNKNLKTLIGHTPLQVIVGAILGVGVGFLINLVVIK